VTLKLVVTSLMSHFNVLGLIDFLVKYKTMHITSVFYQIL